MEQLYHSTNRALHEAQAMLVDAERFGGNSNGQNQNELQRRVEQIAQNCERLDVLVQKEPASRRHAARIRVDQLRQDVRHLTAALAAHKSKRARLANEERGREELLRTRFVSNAEANNGNLLEANSDTSILIDRALEHSNALDRSHRGMDDLLAHGGAILEGLRDQRDTLKGIQRRVLDVAATLGMSGTVMRLIERRQEGDKWVLAGGMLVTVLVMYFTVRFWLWA